MKKLIILLVLSCQIMNCKNDDETSSSDNINIILDIENDYFNNDLQGDLIFSDSEGTILDLIELDDNMSYNFSYPTQKVYLSFIKKFSPNISRVEIETFIVSEDIEIVIAKIPNLNIEEESISIDLNDIDIDFDTAIANAQSSGGSGDDWRITPFSFPTDIIFSFNIVGQPIRKVYFKENIDNSFSDILNINNLLDVSDSTSINYPENSFSYSILSGKKTSDNSFFNFISRDYGQMKTTHKHFLPVSEFNDFILETTIDEDSKNYYTREHFTTFEFSYTKPEIDFNIVEASIDGIMLTDGESCNYFTTFFRDFSNPEFRVFWNIHGKFNQTVETPLPKLESYLQSLNQGFSTSNLDYIHSKGYQIEEPFGLNKFIEFRIERYRLRIEKNKIEYLKK